MIVGQTCGEPSSPASSGWGLAAPPAPRIVTDLHPHRGVCKRLSCSITRGGYTLSRVWVRCQKLLKSSTLGQECLA